MSHGDKVTITTGKLSGKSAVLLSYEPSLDRWWVKLTANGRSEGKKLIEAKYLKLVK